MKDILRVLSGVFLTLLGTFNLLERVGLISWASRLPYWSFLEPTLVLLIGFALLAGRI